MSKIQKTAIGIVAASTLVGAQANTLTSMSQNSNKTLYVTNNTNKKVYNKDSNSNIVKNGPVMVNQNNDVINRNVGFTSVQPPKDLNYEKDLEVSIGKVSYKISTDSGKTTNNSNYIPEDSQPNGSTDIMSPNSNLTVNVPFSMESRSGAYYKLAKVYLVSTPETYDSNNSNNEEDTSVGKTLGNKANSNLVVNSLGEITNATSLSTGMLTANFSNLDIGWNKISELNLELKIVLPNGQTETIPINTKQIKSTAKYGYQIAPIQEGLTQNSTKKFTLNLKNLGLQDASGYSNIDNNKDINNIINQNYVIKYKLSSVKGYFTISLGKEIPGITFDKSTGILTVTKQAIDSTGGNLPITLNYAGAVNSQDQLNMEPISITVNGVKNYLYSNTIKYVPNQFNIFDPPMGDLGINNNATSNYSGQGEANSITSIKGALPANITAYNIFTATNNEYFDLETADNVEEVPPNCYFTTVPMSVNRNVGSSTLNGTTVEATSILTNGKIYNYIVNNPGKVYSSAQIKTMLDKGEKIPEFNCCFSKTEINKGDADYTNQINIEDLVDKTVTGKTIPDERLYFSTLMIVPSKNNTAEENKSLQNYLTNQTQFLNDGDYIFNNPDGSLKYMVQSYCSGAIYDLFYNNAQLSFTSYGNQNSGVQAFNPSQAINISRVFINNNLIDEHYGMSLEDAITPMSFDFNTDTQEDNETNVENITDDKPFIINMGAPFTLTSSPMFGTYNESTGKSTMYSIKYKKVGNYLYCYFPKIGKMNVNNLVTNFTFNAKYDIYDNTTINITTQEPSENDIINNSLVNQSTCDENTGKVTNIASIIVTKNDSTGCIHQGDNIKDNNTTFTDVVYNNNLNTNSYMIYGTVPSNSIGVTSSTGHMDTGDFKAYINKIDCNSKQIYFLTSSELNQLDKSMLTKYNNNLTQSYITNIKDTWTKYNGTVPENAVAYVVFTDIPSNGYYNFDYGVNFKDYNPGDKVYSGFGYVDLTSNLPSQSNIVTVNSDDTVNPNMVLKVISDDGKVLPIQLTGLDCKGEMYEGGPNSKDIPVSIQALENGISNKYNYSIEKVTLNGKPSTLKQVLDDYNNFSGTGTPLINGQNNVVVVLKKNPQYTISSEMVTQDGKVLISPEVEAKGYTGTSEDIKQLKIPEGYKLVKMEIGNNTITSLPNKIGDSNILVKYIVAPIPKKTVTVKLYINGKPYKTIETTTGYEGAPLKLETPTWNKELYKLQSISENNKVITQNDLPTIYQKFDVNIIYNIVDIPGQADVTVKYNNGTIESTKSYTGKIYGTFKGEPEIPQGYKVVSITENGKTVTTPNDEFEPGGTKIVYTISKIPDKTIKQIMINEETGLPIVPSESSSVTGYEGENEVVTPLKVPTGYKLDSITIGDKQITEKELPTKIGTENETIVYKVSPIPLKFNERVVEKLPNGQLKQVSESNTYTVYYNGKTPTVNPTIPEGYHIIETEDNGTQITALPKTITKDTTITYVIQKDVCNATVKTEYPDGSIVKGSSSSQQGLYGSSIKEVPVIPLGYKIKDVTVEINGKTTDYTDLNNIPKTFTVQPINITYHLEEEIGSFQVETQYPDGSVVPGSKYSEQGQVGTKVQNIKESPVKGYYVKSITVNGKSYNPNSSVPSYTTSPQQMVYHLAKIPDNSIVQSVNVVNPKTGAIVKVLENNTVVADSYEGNTVKVSPYDYNKTLYSLKSVTIDGETYSPSEYQSHLPNTIDKKIQHIVYNLVRNEGTVNVKTVISKTGIEVPKSAQTLTGDVATSVTGEHPVIPTGYKLDNITVNGKIVKNVDIDYTGSPQSIVYNISKIPDNSIIENVNVVDNGKIVKRLVIHKEVAEGYEGESVKVTPYSFNKTLYSLQSVDIDGKEYNGTNYINELPDKITDNKQVVTYNLIANKGDITVKTVYKGTGEVVQGSDKTLEGPVGQKVSGATPVVPKGYEISGITINNEPSSQSQVNGLTYNNKTQNIVYTIGKIPNNSITQTVNIVNSKGKVIKVLVPTYTIAEGYEGEQETIKPYNYDKNLYELKSVVINGKTYSAADYQSMLPTSIKDSIQSIVYNLVKKTGEVTYQTDYQNNSVVPNSTGEVTGDIGTKVTGVKPTIPKGYEISKVTYNGKEISQSEINNIEITNNKGSIIYYVNKIPTSTIVTEMKDGNQIIKGSVVSETEEVGNKYDIVNEIIPKGYKLDNILVDGKITPKSKLSDIDFTNNNQTVIYNISKIGTGSISVGVKTEDGQVLVNPETVSGEVGQTVNPEIPQIPKGCRRIGMTLNNKEVSSIDNTIEKGNKTYWIIVDKEVTVKAEVKTLDGKIIGNPIVKEGYEGNELSGITESIPHGYHLVSETINGTPSSVVPNKFPSKDTTIIYTIAPNKINKGTITQQVVNEQETPISNEEIFNGEVGSVDNQKIPQYNTKEYNIVKVYVNGKEVPLNEVPKKVTKGVTKIVYVAQKHAVEDTVRVVYENGTQALPTVTYKGEPGGIVNIIEPSMTGKLKGYEIVGLTINGKKTDELPSVFGNSNGNIVFTIAKKEQTPKDTNPIKKRDLAGTVNIKVEVAGTGQVLESAIHTGVIGSPFNTLQIPKGYHLVDTTYDNCQISPDNVPTTIQKGNNTIVYVVEKNSKPIPKKQVGEVIIKVITTKGQIVNQAEYEGTVGTGFNPISIPKGDKIENITVNGQHTTNVPTQIQNGKTVIIYTVGQPEKVQQFGNVTIKIVDGNRILYYGTSHEVVGTKISQPSIPQGYKLQGVTSTINGQPVNGIPTSVIKGNTVIIYNVTKPEATKVTQKPQVVVGHEEVKVVTVGGVIISNNESNVPVGTAIGKPTIPNGYKIVKVVSTVNGTEVGGIPTSVVKGNTVIVYTIQKNIQPKPEVPKKPLVIHHEQVPTIKPKIVINNQPTVTNNNQPTVTNNQPTVTNNNQPTVTNNNQPTVTNNQPQIQSQPQVQPQVQSQVQSQPQVQPQTKPVGGTPETIESTGDITTNNNSIGGDIASIPTEIHKGYEKLVNDLPHTGLPIGADAGMGVEGLLGLGAVATAVVGALKFKKKKDKEDK